MRQLLLKPSQFLWDFVIFDQIFAHIQFNLNVLLT